MIGQKHTRQLVNVDWMVGDVYRIMMGAKNIFNLPEQVAKEFFTFFGTKVFDLVHTMIGASQSKFDSSHKPWKTIAGTEFVGPDFRAAIVPGKESQGMLCIAQRGKKPRYFRYANDGQRNFAVKTYKTYFK
jgi:hypothetical protein